MSTGPREPHGISGGPRLSERQRGTMREEHSDSGNAWGYFSRDQARSRACRWREDGMRIPFSHLFPGERNWMCKVECEG